jgi:enterochelin esterase-like enzyme
MRIRRERRRRIASTAIPAAAVLASVLAVVVVALATSGSIPLPWNPNRHGAHVLRFTIRSRLVHATLPEVAVISAGNTRRARPLLVFLHGRGAGGEYSILSSEMFGALAAQGRSAPDVVFPNGGVASYWHDRGSGAWASYVVHEVIPAAIRRLHADPHRVAIGGLSMGGFGALDIARQYPERFCAVGADSAALWFRASDTAPGAFDDAADFARHDLIALARGQTPYGRTPLWLDVGTDDPFRATDTALARELRARRVNVEFHVWPGGHDGDYWRAHWQRYMAFYAAQLRRCRR